MVRVNINSPRPRTIIVGEGRRHGDFIARHTIDITKPKHALTKEIIRFGGIDHRHRRTHRGLNPNGTSGAKLMIKNYICGKTIRCTVAIEVNLLHARYRLSTRYSLRYGILITKGQK